jgi:chromosome segregation protein
MHLKSITMKGFKSFPERTRLSFSPGVSVIVGPNGCGKSNITDAVLWALGEQSPTAVRGQTMQDVIFAGGKAQAKRRFAEVEVVIDNSEGRAASEFSEISIRRRLDRSGDGEYRLNGARCRLVDVLEVLSDTNLGGEMHSVISQGKVEEVVHSRPQDRGLLIEEAAGLGKHRKRRRRAELKLKRTRDNLDRALDVEREARTHLRPLKRQAKAAETHARLEHETLGLRARLAADELRAHEAELAEAGEAAASARGKRESLETRLAEVNGRRSEVEERFAERDRERTLLWGRLTALRAAHERLTVRAESLASREAEVADRLERHREALGALVADVPAPAEGEDPMQVELGRIEEALGAATRSLLRARAGEGEPADELAGVREEAERAARAAARAEGLVGRSRQDSLERRILAEGELAGRLRAAGEAVAQAGEAVGKRVAAIERRMLGDEEGTDDVTDELRACSREEYKLQAELREVAEAVTEAEVRAVHVEDRRDEVAAELERIASRLGAPPEAATEPLEESEREEIERGLERLGRRREQLGPVNPLAEREYEDAREHVEELERQREDLETALAELQKLIRDTDHRIRTEFEQTLEATTRNFEELIEHLFPGGRGRLRLVDAPGPRRVLGGAGIGANPLEPEAGASSEGFRGFESERAEAEGSSGVVDVAQGVEIEVTPAGKATRRLSLLSGGEKSLVALAFLFAVFLARPSPFYILDEVEAALDDANIDRFLQLVRRFSDRAQFVIVTHQKRTMDAADVLYGVSMGEGGTTKVISRRFPRDSEQLGVGDESDADAEAAAEAA